MKTIGMIKSLEGKEIKKINAYSLNPTPSKNFNPITLPQIREWLGVTGEWQGDGVKVAVLDTGTDPNHPALKGRILTAIDVTGENNPKDLVGHGVAVQSIIAGNYLETPYGPFEGIAPKCKIISIKVLHDNERGRVEWFIKGLYRAVELGADVINFSGGITPLLGRELDEAVNIIASRGIPVVCAAGNEGIIQSPAQAYKAIAVGSITSRGIISNFSPKRRAMNGYIKPDVVAFGGNASDEAIICPVVGAFDGSYDGIKDGIEPLIGTSWASPQIAGLIALLIQKKKEYSGFY